MSILFKNNIKLLVSDMAGTIINEKGYNLQFYRKSSRNFRL